MTRIDQFESVFLAATRTLYSYERVEVGSAVLVSDLGARQAETFAERVRSFLSAALGDIRWTVLTGRETQSVGELMERLGREKADLVATYRNVGSEAWRWPYSLGEYVDVLTQATAAAVLVVPRPEVESWSGEGTNTDSVLALTDHLTGDAKLVNYAARFTAPGGELCLAHVEDERVLERYLDVISKIPEIDTAVARREIRDRLLKEPSDYIASCKEGLRAHLDLRLSKVVTTGHHVSDVVRLVGELRSDLLVVNTKEEDQLAMHGLAYPLAVELRSLPMLLL